MTQSILFYTVYDSKNWKGKLDRTGNRHNA